MKKFLIVIVAMTAVQSLRAQDVKNLQVLPFKTKKETMDYMKKTIAPSLEVKCSYCHNVRDFPSDENDHKEITREMILMTDWINKNTIKSLKYKPVTCWTCHQGNIYPPRYKGDKGKGHEH
jgi:photosynthetic reaction center cytochrome c subunit|tara:strand:+ start:1251 stop:1613 length:363 start_codon:yes stop_codon:yes gene_type:complete